MKIKSLFKKVVLGGLFSAKWTCNACGAENFNDDYFCESCKNKLPYIKAPYCDHCGRLTVIPENYCYTCKGRLVSIEKARSVFDYKPPISGLIKAFKYENKRYLAEYFAKELAYVYFRNFLCADLVTFVPMTDKAKKNREYNQSEILAEELSKIIKVPLLSIFEKVKETERQATLNREERLKNLKGAFKIKARKLVKDKRILIVDDVSTTGTTAEILASLCVKAKAKAVCLLTIASVSTINLENL